MVKLYRGKRMEEKIITTYNALLKEWQVPIKEMDIPTSYGSTHVIHCGNLQGKPVLLFHGVGDDSALMWIYNMKAWVKEFNLYAIDTLGGPGKSRPNESYAALFDEAKWIDEIREALNLGKVNLIGVSHGGYVVQYYNLVRHEWVDKAICMSAAVPEKPKNNQGENKAQKGNSMKIMMKIFLPEALFPTQHNIVKLLAKLSGDNVQVFTENPCILSHYIYLLKGFNNMAMKYHKLISFTDEEIESIKKNTYYIVGNQDPFQQLGGKQTIENHHMNVCFMNNAGHGINHEEAERINLLIREILLDQVEDLSMCMIE